MFSYRLRYWHTVNCKKYIKAHGLRPGHGPHRVTASRQSLPVLTSQESPFQFKCLTMTKTRPHLTLQVPFQVVDVGKVRYNKVQERSREVFVWNVQLNSNLCFLGVLVTLLYIMGAILVGRCMPCAIFIRSLPMVSYVPSKLMKTPTRWMALA